MPLTRPSYPYVDTLRIPSANIGSLFTSAQTFPTPFIVQTNSPAGTSLIVRAATSQSADIFQVQNSLGTNLTRVTSNGNTVFSGGVNIFEGDVRVGTSSYFSGALSVSARVANEIGAVVRGFTAQTSNLQEWQDSAGSVQSAVASDGTFFIKQIRNVGGNVNRLVMSDASSTVIVNSGNIFFVGLSVRRFNDSQTADLQQWTNSTGGTVFAKVDASGNFTTTGTVTTGGALNLNYASPAITSNNASAASIFTSTVTGITIGSSTIKTIKYPAEPSGTTTGTVTQAAQLSGYIGMPQNPQVTSGTFTYTFAASDAGKHIYATGTPTSATFTIPANSAVAFEIGTTFVIMNDLGAATNISIAITTDTLQLAGTGTTGTRTLARYGVASITKVTSTKWIISGNGLT